MKGKKNCSPGSKLVPFRADPFQEVICVQRSNQEVTKVISLHKNGRKPFKCIHSLQPSNCKFVKYFTVCFFFLLFLQIIFLPIIKSLFYQILLSSIQSKRTQLTAFPPDPGRDLDLGPPRPVLLGDAPRPLGWGVKLVSESHLSNSSLTNLSICSLLTSSLVPSDCKTIIRKISEYVVQSLSDNFKN